MSVTPTSAQRQQVAPISRLWWVGLVAAAGAAVANLIVYFVTLALGVPYIMPLQGPTAPLETLSAAAVVFASVVPAIAATILLAILGRFSARPVRLFQIIAVVILVLSIVPVVLLPATVALSTKICLMLMHVAAGAVIISVLSTMGRRQ